MDTGDAGSTFNRHWVGVGLYARPELPDPPWQTRGVEPVLVLLLGQRSDQHWVNISCLLGVLTGHIVVCTSPGVKILKLLPH